MPATIQQPIPEDIDKRVKILAVKMGTSKKQIVIDSLKMYLEKYEKEKESE